MMWRRITTYLGWLLAAILGLMLVWRRRSVAPGRIAADEVEADADDTRADEDAQDVEDAAAVAEAHGAPIETLPEMDPPLAWWRPPEGGA